MSDLELSCLPSKDMSAKYWHEWKGQLMTKHMKLFLDRHPWYSFRKQDIYNVLGDKTNVPRIFSQHVKVTEFQGLINDYGPKFVLKKQKGHSSQGTLVLHRREDELFNCFLTGKSYSISELQDFILSEPCIMEESLSQSIEAIPLDFKCYIVNSSVKYVAVINRNCLIPTIQHFDAKSLSFVPIDDIFSSAPAIWLEGSGPFDYSLYKRIKLAIQEAEHIAENYLDLENILCSLDMYVTSIESGYKVWLGQITPRPGALHSNWLKKGFIENSFNPL